VVVVEVDVVAGFAVVVVGRTVVEVDVEVVDVVVVVASPAMLVGTSMTSGPPEAFSVVVVASVTAATSTACGAVVVDGSEAGGAYVEAGPAGRTFADAFSMPASRSTTSAFSSVEVTGERQPQTRTATATASRNLTVWIWRRNIKMRRARF
jgi:hypothetical protein